MREHDVGDGVDAENLIGSLLKEVADLERNCANEDVAVKAFITPHTRRNRRTPIWFIMMAALRLGEEVSSLER